MLKYLIAIVLTLIAVGCAILLIVFLTSAAIYGSEFLTLGCIAALFIFFYSVSLLNKKHETENGTD
jgi:hypothetical protein